MEGSIPLKLTFPPNTYTHTLCHVYQTSYSHQNTHTYIYIYAYIYSKYPTMIPTGPRKTLYSLHTHTHSIYKTSVQPYIILPNTTLRKHMRIRACIQYVTFMNTPLHTNALHPCTHIQYTTVSNPDLDNCHRCNSKDNISPSFRISIFII